MKSSAVEWENVWHFVFDSLANLEKFSNCYHFENAVAIGINGIH